MEFLILVGSVAMLMYGMKVMSEGLQKMAGSRLRTILGTMTTNRFTGLLTGAFITTSIQSSTATTVMTVSFVSAGLLTLSQAISVIMGANIGTTATAWIMVLGGSFDMRMQVSLQPSHLYIQNGMLIWESFLWDSPLCFSDSPL